MSLSQNGSDYDDDDAGFDDDDDQGRLMEGFKAPLRINLTTRVRRASWRARALSNDGTEQSERPR